VDAESGQIERKIAVAGTIQWICFALVVVPVACGIIYLAVELAGQRSEDQGWIALGAMPYLYIGGPILLIPLLGFLGAWGWKVELRHKLGAYRPKGRE
jgi:hypothetical protein